MVALLSVAMIEAEESTSWAHGVLLATVPLTIASNAWDFPMQLLLVAGYLLYRAWSRRTIDWKSLLTGGAVTGVLIYPSLIRFAPHAGALHNTIRLVPRGLHTPFFAGILVFYPLLAVLLLNLFFAERSRQSRAFRILWVVLLAISELVFVDDLYGGKFERFNTALKWWAWIYSGGLLTVGAINLRAPSRICRWGTTGILVLISAYALQLFGDLENLPKPHLGQLDGAAWIRDDPAQRAILAFLKTQPQSIVLQKLPDRAYIPAPALIILAGQTALLGWPNHEDTWRGYRADIDHRLKEITQFYNGDLPEAERWLEANHVEYILWLGEDGPFEKIDRQIHDGYFWRDYAEENSMRNGLWARRPSP
jgi:hypothetical protein